MIIPDKKKAASVIVSRMAEMGAEPKDDMPDMDPSEAIADDVMAAVKSGSASDLAAALKAFVAQCGSEPEEEYED